MRQDDALEHHFRPDRQRTGHRRTDRPESSEDAQEFDRLHVRPGRPHPLAQPAPKRRIRPGAAERQARRSARTGCGDARPRRPAQQGRPVPEATFTRHAATRQSGSDAVHRSGIASGRRALRRAGRPDQDASAEGIPGHLGADTQDGRLRHARPQRSLPLGRPDRGHARWADRQGSADRLPTAP